MTPMSSYESELRAYIVAIRDLLWRAVSVRSAKVRLQILREAIDKPVPGARS